MLIAVMSLLTSIYNGYLNNKFVNLIQSNLTRAEYMRTCKETIDAYFQVKFRSRLVNENADRTGATGASPAQVDAGNAVNKFAALGTYLANLRDETIRARYSELSRRLEEIARDARGTPPEEFNKRFEPADRLFAEMNDDCVKSAQAAPL
jgi:5'-deoxynucleotidase YfbR-like HD superfamily hydrolase